MLWEAAGRRLRGGVGELCPVRRGRGIRAGSGAGRDLDLPGGCRHLPAGALRQAPGRPLRLRVHLFCPPGFCDRRRFCSRRPAEGGSDLGGSPPCGGGRGGRRTGLRPGRSVGIQPGIGHPLRHRPHQKQVHRPHVHRPRSGAPAGPGAAEAQRRSGECRREAGGPGG